MNRPLSALCEHAQTCYLSILSDRDLQYVTRGPWAIVDRGFDDQGWKLHVSTTPVQAHALLEAVVPVLIAARCSFKIAGGCESLEGLNAGLFGASQVGKFVTVYPQAAHVRDLALKLREVTRSFEGPAVLTDVRLGDVLYSRYGSFRERFRRDRLGVKRNVLTGPDGELRDDVYHMPHQKPEHVPYPFEGLEVPCDSAPAGGSRSLLTAGYVPLEVLKESVRGSVLLGMSVKRQGEVALRIIKHGRRHCMSDRLGRDVRWRLRREFQACRDLDSISGTTRAIEYFELAGDGYLVLDHFDGKSIETIVDERLGHRPWVDLDRTDRMFLLTCLESLARVIRDLHGRGFVHRDISHSNVWVRPNGQVVLLDMEMAHREDDAAPCVGLGTAGFLSPEQIRGERVSRSDDVYSTGCVVFLTLTGIDPRRLRATTQDSVRQQLTLLTGDAAELGELRRVVARCIAERRALRPPIDEVLTGIRSALRACSGAERNETLRVSSRARSNGRTGLVETMLERLADALTDAAPADREGRWLSPPLGIGEQGLSMEQLELARSAHCGVAGVVYLLARLQRLRGLRSLLLERAREATQWLLVPSDAYDVRMPGLYFGSAGMAVAIAEALQVHWLTASPAVETTTKDWLTGTLDWPDVMHGAAGQGLAALQCRPELAPRCGDYLVDTQDADGAWAIPQGFGPVSGQRMTGFAHGVAGIVYFLAELDAQGMHKSAGDAWRQGADWLERQAVRTRTDRVEWPYSTSNPAIWRWWCHGAAGIALCYIRLFELTREPVFESNARLALHIHPPALRHGNLSFCHGLSGLGEVYLEMFRVTQDEQWLARSFEIAEAIHAVGQQSASGGLSWTVDSPTVATADLGVGIAGIAHFMLRLATGGNQLSFPLLPGPARRP